MLQIRHDGPLPRLVLARTVFGRPLYTVSVYAVGDTLIDSGPPATAGELVQWARRNGVRRVVHTHHHEDHTGGDRRLVDELGIEVLAPPATCEAIGSRQPLPCYRRLTWGQPAAVTAHPYHGEVTAGGLQWRAIPTPGHAEDHVALWQPERRWLFSGDLFVARRVVYLRREEHAWVHLDSLERLRALGPEAMFCAHAGFVPDAVAALTARIDFWRRLAERSRQLAAEGLGVRAVRRRLLGREGLMTLLSGGDFSKTNLIRSLLRGERSG